MKISTVGFLNQWRANSDCRKTVLRVGVLDILIKMKKKVIKMAVAAVCVVTAGVGGMNAYDAANQSETDMLFAENVEALSSGEARIGCVNASGECPLNGVWIPNACPCIVSWR